MTHHLSVTPDGLRAASAALNEHAGELTGANGAVPAGSKASTAGAASFAASIEAFSQAYAGRLRGHGQSAEVAAGSYTSTYSTDTTGMATKTTTFDIPGTDGVTISDKRMGALHTAGLAQEYIISCSGSVYHYDGPLSSHAPLGLPNAPDNRDGTRSDPGRYG